MINVRVHVIDVFDCADANRCLWAVHCHHLGTGMAYAARRDRVIALVADIINALMEKSINFPGQLNIFDIKY